MTELMPAEPGVLALPEVTRDQAIDFELLGLAVQATAQPVKREGELSRQQLTAMLENIGEVPIYIRTFAVLRRGVRDEQTGEFVQVSRDVVPHWPANEW